MLSLKRRSEFRRVFDSKNSTANRLVVLRWVREESGPGRVGIVVSRRNGGAVVRNRIKRRLREALRLQGGALVAGARLVILPRGGAREAKFSDLRRAVLEVLIRSGLHKEES